MQRTSRIFIVGHNDSVENSLCGYFQAAGFKKAASNTRDRVNVLDERQVENFFKRFKPEYVFLGSLRSGGIAANQQFPGEFIYENLRSQSLVIEAARRYKTKKLMYFSSSCVYPTDARQPIKESSLLTGALEPTSASYAVAKIAGGQMCRAYKAQYNLKTVTVVPATLYGPGSDADMGSAHVLGALIAKFHKAKSQGDAQVVVWGSGQPRREFLYVDDFAQACVRLMKNDGGHDLINVGTGSDVTIRQLAMMIKAVSGFKGKIKFDASKPDGVRRKLLDNSQARKLGCRPKMSLEEGIEKTYQWYASV